MVIVTIDGPAGAGKSTVAKLLADQLDFQYLDTGAMYRAMTFAAVQLGINLEDSIALHNACANANLEFSLDHIKFDGKSISDEIRTPEISRQVKYVADHEEIRKRLVQTQRELAASADIVCEGRDQGTVAFPNADCKIFLTASPEARAKRRHDELSKKGFNASVEQIKNEQDERDARDAKRPVGALKKADDAIEFFTDGFNVEQVVEQLQQVVEKKLDTIRIRNR